jgi:hypothetical protein
MKTRPKYTTRDAACILEVGYFCGRDGEPRDPVATYDLATERNNFYELVLGNCLLISRSIHWPRSREHIHSQVILDFVGACHLRCERHDLRRLSTALREAAQIHNVFRRGRYIEIRMRKAGLQRVLHLLRHRHIVCCIRLPEFRRHRRLRLADAIHRRILGDVFRYQPRHRLRHQNANTHPNQKPERHFHALATSLHLPELSSPAIGQRENKLVAGI